MELTTTTHAPEATAMSVNTTAAHNVLRQFGKPTKVQHEGTSLSTEYVIVATTTTKVRILSRSDEYALRFEVGLLQDDDANGDLQRTWFEANVTKSTGRTYGDPVAEVNWSSFGAQTADRAAGYAKVLELSARVANILNAFGAK